MQTYEIVSIYRNNHEIYFVQSVDSPLVANALQIWPVPLPTFSKFRLS